MMTLTGPLRMPDYVIGAQVSRRPVTLRLRWNALRRAARRRLRRRWDRLNALFRRWRDEDL
ncbi:hypothetical protein AB0F43_31425 [Kribbella sp. NPDC023972]|uniref:hypothetical protein n=1 Tax=Kribbella sp. NPDC023972 TaxID=3154795 RepID=UPI0033F4E42D